MTPGLDSDHIICPITSNCFTVYQTA
jgi:hypothetical protein